MFLPISFFHYDIRVVFITYFRVCFYYYVVVAGFVAKILCVLYFYANFTDEK